MAAKSTNVKVRGGVSGRSIPSTCPKGLPHRRRGAGTPLTRSFAGKPARQSILTGRTSAPTTARQIKDQADGMDRNPRDGQAKNPALAVIN